MKYRCKNTGNIIEIEDTVVLYPCLINSNILTAQNRLRYYWTNIKTRTDWTGDVFTDIPQPEDRKIFLKDIIESGEVYEDKSKPLLEKTALAYQFKDQIKQQNYFKKRKEFGIISFVKEATKKGYLEIKQGDSLDLAYPESKTIRGRLMTDKSNALLRQNEFYYNTGEYLRLFTQTELERLQGFPDGWTSVLSYNHASSLLGDGWTLPVIEHIFSFINTKNQNHEHERRI